MAVPVFSDLYLGSCEKCGSDLEDWDWLEDDMAFHTTCTCGAEYNLEPTAGILTGDTDSKDEEDEDDE